VNDCTDITEVKLVKSFPQLIYRLRRRGDRILSYNFRCCCYKRKHFMRQNLWKT